MECRAGVRALRAAEGEEASSALWVGAQQGGCHCGDAGCTAALPSSIHYQGRDLADPVQA